MMSVDFRQKSVVLRHKLPRKRAAELEAEERKRAAELEAEERKRADDVKAEQRRIQQEFDLR